MYVRRLMPLVVGLAMLAFGTGTLPAQEKSEPKIEARLARDQKPRYPLEARQQNLEGRVVLWISVSAEGEVLDAKVHRSSGSTLLDDHTLRFARTLEFVPARRGKTSIATTVLLPVRYTLVDPK